MREKARGVQAVPVVPALGYPWTPAQLEEKNDRQREGPAAPSGEEGALQLARSGPTLPPVRTPRAQPPK